MGSAKVLSSNFFIMGWTDQCKKLLLLVTSDTLKYNGVELINNIHNSAMDLIPGNLSPASQNYLNITQNNLQS